jgi:hypothetical protein
MFPSDLVNSGFSQLKDLGSKVNLDSAKNLISSGVDRVSGAAKGLFASKVPSFNLPTSFPKSPDFGPNSASIAAQGSADMHRKSERAYANSPEASRKMFKAPDGAAYVYPANQKYYTLFTFNQYERIKANEAPKEKTSVSIVLPMPPDLREEFNVGYAEPSLGIVGSVADSVIKGVRSAQGASTSQGSTSDKDLGSSVYAAIGSGIIKGLESIPKGGETAGAIARMATGLSPNPYLAVVFKDVALRSHTFQYRFSPRSEAELKTLKNIIRELKKRMLPGLTQGSDLLFTFPDTCDISFGPTKDVPYRIKKCVMTSMSVNYSPNGPAFFKTGDPVIVDIQMTFREMSAFTRIDLGEEREAAALPQAPPGNRAADGTDIGANQDSTIG